MTLLGLNVAPDADPSELAAIGARWVRCVYRSSINMRPWLTALLDSGIETLLVGDSSPDSLGDDAAQWSTRMADARDTLGDLVKLWSWGNEPDGEGVASWRMGQHRVNRLLQLARAVFPRPTFRLIGPGLVSGQPGWLQYLGSVEPMDAIDIHPYAKFVQTAPQRLELTAMLRGYLAFGKPLWCGEYDSRTPGLSAFLRDFPGVERAAAFCWDEGMTAAEGIVGMGIRQNRAAYADFLAATGGSLPVPPRPAPVPPPMPPIPAPVPVDVGWIGSGLQEAIARLGWHPLDREGSLDDRTNWVPCEEGYVVWLHKPGRAFAVPWEVA